MRFRITRRGETRKPLKRLDEEVWEEKRRELYRPPEKIKIDQTEPASLAHKPLPISLHLLIVALALAAFLSVVLSYRGIGLTWDEAYYYNPSLKAGMWLGSLLKGDGLGDTGIYWSTEPDDIPELPSVVKLLNGVSVLSFSKYYGVLTAFRLPAAAAFAITGALIYVIGLIGYNRRVGLLAALMYYLMPRVFGHAHLGASESITVFMMLLVVLSFIKGLESGRWSVITGALFGIALATKINCVFLPIMLFVWGHLYYRNKYINNAFAMLFLGPIVWFLVWPLLWHDTFAQILHYFYFHAAHQHTPVFFLGQKYNVEGLLVPWHYPFFMTLFTLPLTFLILFLIGLGRTVANMVKDKIGALVIIGAFFPLVLSSMPFSPQYDGVRLFFPAFPFVALLAAVGCVAFLYSLPRITVPKISVSLRDAIGIGLVFIVLLNGLYAIRTVHPFELSFFNSLIGGLPGAEKKGMETTYWGEALNEEALSFLNNNIPDGAKIKALAMHDRALMLYQEWGSLKDTLILDSPPPYDYHILLARKGLFMRPERYLFDHYEPIKTIARNGVPLLLIYKTGPRFEEEWWSL